MESLLDSALAYALKGFAVLPLRPGQKVPLTKNGLKDASKNDGVIRQWWQQTPDANIGLLTDGLIVIDIDGPENPWPQDQEQAASLIDTAVSVTANGGRHHVFRSPYDKSYRNTAGRLAESVDTRAAGGYIVVYPSRLESGGVYQWIDGLELPEFSQVPYPPKWLLESLDGLEEKRTAGPIVPVDGEVLEGSRNASLARLAGSMRRVGLGVDEIFAALQATNAARVRPRLDDREVRRIAESICKYEPNPIAVAKMSAEEDDTPVVASPGDPGTFPEHLYDVPGFVNGVQEYINRTSHRLQPILALAASLSLQACIVGRRVADEINTRANLYSIGVAPSGGGKEAGRQAIKDILYKAGAHQLLGEGIASHAGLITSMSSQPSMLWLIDEIGRWIRSINQSGGSQPHLAGIVTNLLKLYSSAGSVFLGDSYADSEKRKTINQPNCCLYGTTVPESLYAGLTSESITDGFLSRVLIWETPGERPRKRRPGSKDLDPVILSYVREWLGNSTSFQHVNPEIQTIPTTADALAILEDFEIACDESANSVGEPLGTLWTRAGEKSRKLALLYACSNGLPGECIEIGEDAAVWAVAVSRWQTERLIYLCDRHVSDGAFDMRRKKVFRAIEAAGKVGLTQSELTRRTQSLAPRDRNEVLEALVESKEIAIKMIGSGGPGRKTTRFVATVFGAC
jgi:hypothetical protein